MKLLVFAHTPPPHHGQSYMVQLMLEGFGGDCRKQQSGATHPANFGIECYHVNARFSKGVHEIGGFHPRKLALVSIYCLQAVWCRFRYGVRNFYYVPAPGHRAALYRDWLVMLLCRPFFERVILHWHAAGLTEWLQTSAPSVTRWLSHRLLGRPDLSIVLSHFNLVDGERLLSRQNKIIHNGIPDPCPEFKRDVLPRRAARVAARRKLLAGQQVGTQDQQDTGGNPQVVKVLFLSQCSRAKGLFDTLEAVALANRTLDKENCAIRVHLTVAGEFLGAAERQEFDTRIGESDLQLRETPGHQARELEGPNASCSGKPAVCYVGFLAGDEKKRAFAQSDCLCLPVTNPNESVDPEPLALIEAMAFGLPIVTTRWRSLSELVPRDCLGPVERCSPQQIADAILRAICEDSAERLRDAFVSHFSLARHWGNLAAALATVEQPTPPGKGCNTDEGGAPEKRHIHLTSRRRGAA